MNDYIIYFTHDNLHVSVSGDKTTEIYVNAVDEEYHNELTASEDAQQALRFSSKAEANRTINTFLQSSQAERVKMMGYNGPFLRPVRAQIPVRKHIKI